MDPRSEAEQWRQRARTEERWRPAIGQICERAGIVCKSVRGDFHSNNAVFLLDGSYVVKLYAPDQRASWRVEEAALQRLAANPTLPVPPLVAVGELAGVIACPYLVMGMVPGRPLDALRGQFSAAERIDIAAQLGALIARFHRADVSFCPQLESAQGGWRSLYRRRLRQLVEELDQTAALPAGLAAELRAFCRSREVAAYLEAPRVLVHGDLTCYHVYAEKRADGWRVSGLIDLGNALVAPPEYDWIDLWLQTFERDVQQARAFFQAYRPNLIIDEQYRRRLLAFFLHSWEAIPQLLAHLQAERVPVMADMQVLLDWLWPPELEASQVVAK